MPWAQVMVAEWAIGLAEAWAKDWESASGPEMAVPWAQPMVGEWAMGLLLAHGMVGEWAMGLAEAWAKDWEWSSGQQMAAVSGRVMAAMLGPAIDEVQCQRLF